MADLKATNSLIFRNSHMSWHEVIRFASIHSKDFNETNYSAIHPNLLIDNFPASAIAWVAPHKLSSTLMKMLIGLGTEVLWLLLMLEWDSFALTV